MLTASLRPLAILSQICTVWCTKLQKHFNAIILEVFYCFTVSIDLPGDVSDCDEDKWVNSCSAHTKHGGCRVRRQ